MTIMGIYYRRDRPTGVARELSPIKTTKQSRTLSSNETGNNETFSLAARHALTGADWSEQQNVRREPRAGNGAPAPDDNRFEISTTNTAPAPLEWRRKPHVESKCAKIVFIHLFFFSTLLLHCAYSKTNMRNINLLHKWI